MAARATTVQRTESARITTDVMNQPLEWAPLLSSSHCRSSSLFGFVVLGGMLSSHDSTSAFHAGGGRGVGARSLVRIIRGSDPGNARSGSFSGTRDRRRYQHATIREVEGICRSSRRAAHASGGSQREGAGCPMVPRSRSWYVELYLVSDTGHAFGRINCIIKNCPE